MDDKAARVSGTDCGKHTPFLRIANVKVHKQPASARTGIVANSTYSPLAAVAT